MSHVIMMVDHGNIAHMDNHKPRHGEERLHTYHAYEEIDTTALKYHYQYGLGKFGRGRRHNIPTRSCRTCDLLFAICLVLVWSDGTSSREALRVIHDPRPAALPAAKSSDGRLFRLHVTDY